MLLEIAHPDRLIYPESDGKPIGDNTIQFRWIVTLFNGFDGLFASRPDVFVAGDLFWYPRYGDPTTVQAPDVMVAFGRPKGDRPSYKQWEEGDIAPQVAVEVLSPSNTAEDMDRKFEFYQKYGVEEYYEYDPDAHVLRAWMRSRKRLVAVKSPDGFVSPRLGVRFEAPKGVSMRLLGPDGKPFRSYVELLAEAEGERKKAEADRRKAKRERDRLAAKLRELGVDPDAL